jgi:hypothetical protein
MVRESYSAAGKSAQRMPHRCTPRWHRVALLLLGVHVAWQASGCAATGYRYGRFHSPDADDVEPQPVVVERGKPHKTLDRLAWIVGIPSKIFTLNAKTNNHAVSDETVEELTAYLEANDLGDVYVSVNDYNPKLQWRRLRENCRVGPFWRYTVGTGAWLGYTFFPNRVFGGDEYNPFTNTLIVSSDVPALVLAEAAYAKDVRSRRHPGLYATVSELPVVSLWRHSQATSDVVTYARANHDWETERQAYEVLYPQIGATTFGPVAHFVPVAGPFLSITGAAVGQVTGRTVARLQEPAYLNAAPGEEDGEEPGQEGEELAGMERRPDKVSPATAESGVVTPAAYERAE